MTLIVALKDKNGKAYIGNDWITTAGWEIISASADKTIQIWWWIIWIAGIARLKDIIKNMPASSYPKKISTHKDVSTFAKKVVWAVTLYDIEFGIPEDSQKFKGTEMCIIWKKNIFEVYWHWDVVERKYTAIWSWQSYAIWILKYLELQWLLDNLSAKDVQQLIYNTITAVSHILPEIGWDISVKNL